MCNNHESGIRGGSINPRARNSIHDHPDCPFASERNMVQNVQNSLNNTRPGGSQLNKSLKDGYDEVDNVLSKFAHPTSSPIPARHNRSKRNSLDSDKSPYTDDSENSSVHAKSLPANFSPLSSENDEIYHWPKYHNNSSSTIESDISGNVSNKYVQENYRENNVENQNTSNVRDTQIKMSKSYQSVFGIILGLAVVAVAIQQANDRLNIYKKASEAFDTNDQTLQFRFKHDLHHIGDKYNINDDAILRLQTGVSTILERQDTGSFIFAFNSNKVDVDSIDNFVESVALTASRYLRNKSSRPVVVDGAKLTMRTHSELMNEYRDTVTSNGVLLVKNLDGVSSALAMAFHYYCDEYNPLIKKSAILFTLDMARCSYNPVEQRPTITNIENCLKKKWSGVSEDNIRPLINRVVNAVIDVTD